MEKLAKKLTIIKYGTNTLVTTDVNGEITIDQNNMKNHGLLISAIKNPVIIVSSGAVAFGKSLGSSFDYIEDNIIRKRVFAALGNPHLSINWDKVIKDKQVLQSLITHRDLTFEDSKEKIAEIIHALFDYNGTDNVVIQVNDNDFITDEALIEIRHGEFGDNDETTALLTILCQDVFEEVEVIVNTSSDGVLDNGKLLSEIKNSQLSDDYIEAICGADKTNDGTGGMRNKLKIFRDMVSAAPQSKLTIVNGKKPEQLNAVIRGEKIGTVIIS